MTLRIPNFSKRLLSLVLACSVLAACGAGTSETEQLRAELEELRQQMEAGNELSDGAETTDSTTTVASTTLPPDPRATVAEAAAAWEAMGHVADAVTPPALLDGIPIAAVSSTRETVVWQWDGMAWEPLQYISHPDDGLTDIVGLHLRDLSGDDHPELIVHRGWQLTGDVDVYTPVFTMFVPVDFDASRIQRDVFRRPSWRLDGTTLYLTVNSCSPYCAVGEMIDIAFRWENGMMTAQEEKCQRYVEYAANGGSEMAICHKGPTVRQVQAALQNGGFNPGQIDGFFGPATEFAVMLFQHIFGMEKTGSLYPSDVSFLIRTYP